MYHISCYMEKRQKKKEKKLCHNLLFLCSIWFCFQWGDKEGLGQIKINAHKHGTVGAGIQAQQNNATKWNGKYGEYLY